MTQPRKTPRIPLSPSVRQYILERDRHQCQSCGTSQDLSIDHIIPLALGGSNDLSNLQTLCRPCNSRKNKHHDRRFDRRYHS